MPKNKNQEKTQSKPRIDWITFSLSLLLLMAINLPLLRWPDKGIDLLYAATDYTMETFGILYLWVGFGALAFLLWISWSKLGSIKLGHPQEKRAFSTFSWGAMLFCAGIGSSVMYWGTIEWAYYFDAPPFGLKAGSSEAIEWAAAFGMFHWGPTAWAIYCLPALPAAYLYHIRNRPVLKVSESCRPLLGRYADGALGKTLDILLVLGVLGSAGTTLGLGIPMISAAFEKLTGIPPTIWVDIALLSVCAILFSISVYSGLGKGIKRLSDLNLLMASSLLLFVVLAGPSGFLLKMATNSIGLVATYFFRLNTWIDPILQSGFTENWTLFYWAWWIVFAPFVGLFIAKISRGRTLRQMILGSLIWGTLGCALFFAILGNYALYLEVYRMLPVTAILNELGGPAAIIYVIASLPFGKALTALFALLAIIFLATTFDTSAYMIAAITQREISDDPARWNRLFWAVVICIFPVTLMFVGGLKTLKTVTVLGSLPVIVILFLLVGSFIKLVKEDGHLK